MHTISFVCLFLATFSIDDASDAYDYSFVPRGRADLTHLSESAHCGWLSADPYFTSQSKSQ